MQKPFSSQFAHLKDLEGHTGQLLGISEWFLITQDKIDTFARVTEDQQWIHTDPEVAKIHSPYGTTIAHGFMVLSLASRFIYEVYKVDDVIMGVNYGLDNVRFPSAAPVDSELRAHVTLTGYEPMDEGAKLIMNIRFEIKGQEKPCCIADFIALAMTGQVEDI